MDCKKSYENKIIKFNCRIITSHFIKQLKPNTWGNFASNQNSKLNKS